VTRSHYVVASDDDGDIIDICSVPATLDDDAAIKAARAYLARQYDVEEEFLEQLYFQVHKAPLHKVTI
jgi:hypothetical protein